MTLLKQRKLKTIETAALKLLIYHPILSRVDRDVNQSVSLQQNTIFLTYGVTNIHSHIETFTPT